MVPIALAASGPYFLTGHYYLRFIAICFAPFVYGISYILIAGWSSDSYTDAIKAILPAVAGERLAEFVDVFPEEGFFTLGNAIEFADCARKYGLKLKIHADEFTPYKVSDYPERSEGSDP